MGRRGELTVGMVVTFAVAILALVILIFILNKGSGGFLGSLSCEGDGLYQIPKSQTCTENGYKPYLMGFLTEDGMTCCRDPNFEGGGGSFGGAGASAKFTGTQASGKALVEGQTVQFYASSAQQPHAIALQGKIECADNKETCSYSWQEYVVAPTGERLSGVVAGTGAGGGQADDGERIEHQATFTIGSQYLDQPLTYTFQVFDENQNVIDTYTLRVKLSSPIKYAGLTQAWSKRKEVTATCESPVTCTDILFRVQEDETKCDIPTDEGKLLETSYCIVKDGQITKSCETSRDACTTAILNKNDQQYTGALAAIKAAVNNNLTNDSPELENVLYQFATQQGQTSTYQCVKSTQGESSAGTLYRVRVDPTTERASFTLEHQSFEGKNVCIYGKDTSGAVYAGKGPIPLKLDVTPPNAILDFRPGSLQLRYSCTDTLSGCKDTFGIAYISQTGDFLRALVAKDTLQNAAAWCPSYTTASGYRVETRPIVNYADNEVRVLCLRVEDQAGNAGVAMTTVYNAYDLFANALALAIQESD